jgi:hypothetical protein
VCDFCTDTDHDGYGDPEFPANTCPRDNCAGLANRSQTDSDRDCIGDDCDPEPGVYDSSVPDSYPPQGNGIGDACDCEGNFNCDSGVDGIDTAIFKADYGRNSVNNPCTDASPCHGDFSCNGTVDGIDAAVFKKDYGRMTIFNPCPPCEVGTWCSY